MQISEYNKYFHFEITYVEINTLQWRHNGPMASQITSLTSVYSSVNSGADQRKTSKLRVTGLCVGNSSGTDEFPAQMASNAEKVSIWWRHHEYLRKSSFGADDVSDDVTASL